VEVGHPTLKAECKDAHIGIRRQYGCYSHTNTRSIRMRRVLLVCLFIRNNSAAIDRQSLKYTLGNFTKICRTNSILFKIWQK